MKDLTIDFLINYSNLGNYYDLPDGINQYSAESKEYFAGSNGFEISEIEVF